ncbi:spermine/spermidine synthase family protein [Paecilomyces variotii No. 5]|uniref:Spermine/spermidine synthase family protein n=1 Tax=Byssochlamys spectabilis (strain No. 5 / NBRC 109023) TaxID=1356009 RepID=V5FIL4_BYSSN|nr:spermine/spermidine synthase family protein [Paecilomyces variotii No. 5]
MAISLAALRQMILAHPKALAQGLSLLVLAAAYSPVSVLNLAPVYGGAATRLFHRYGMAVTAILGWFLKERIHEMSRGRIARLLPVLAVSIAAVQFLLFKLSSWLGSPFGPVITEAFTYYPLLALSIAASAKLIQYATEIQRYGDTMAEHGPLIASYVIFNLAERISEAFISKVIGCTFLLTRYGLQLVIAALYAITVPSKSLLLTLPMLLLSYTSNVHIPTKHTTALLNERIQPYGFELIDRRDSVTGYISVLDNLNEGYRVMRADHSLLGGEWTKLPGQYNPKVKDPIYAVFTMLEAVRLVETEPPRPADQDSKALVIGLGIGTTPGSLISHGIDTTIVEIDPVVYYFANKYFHLPHNHTAAIQDAEKFVQKTLASPASPRYDYIVHDVFTGGAEPINLFTVEFLQQLSDLLKDNGVIAIVRLPYLPLNISPENQCLHKLPSKNFAGDLSLYPAGLVVRTIKHVFPSCRIFREDAAMENHPAVDFTNMVVFCTKATGTPVHFRNPIPADFLGSKARETYLMPKHEIDASVFETVEKGGQRLLKAEGADHIAAFQDQSAIGHWKIMRTVLPDAVWENW